MRTLKHWGTSFLPLYILLVWPPDGDRVMPVSKATHHKSSFTCYSELFVSAVPVQQRKRRLKTAVKHNYILLETKHAYEERASIHTRYVFKFNCRLQPLLYHRARAGRRAGKNNNIEKYTFSNKRNLWWNKNIRLANLAEASKFMIGPFRSYHHKVSPRETFSPARWCSLRTNNEVFLLQTVLNLVIVLSSR